MEEFISCLIKCNIGFSFHLGFGTLLLPCMLKKKKKKKRISVHLLGNKEGKALCTLAALPQILRSSSGSLPWGRRACGREVVS